MPATKDLSGHSLLIILHMDLPDELLHPIRSRFPGLDVKFVKHNTWELWSLPGPEKVSDDDWRKTTVLVAGAVVPSPDKVPNLQLVQLQSAGANHMFETPLFKDTDVPFCTANGVHGPQIAEWVICTYLAHQHALPTYLARQSQAKWIRNFDDPMRDCVSQRVGILGYGSIGRQIARVATAMGMSVHAYTNSPRPTPESKIDTAYHVPGLGDPDGTLPSKWFSGTSKAEIAEFLSSGLDLLVIAAPLTPATQGLMGRDEFRILSEAGASTGKHKTYISNIARGGLVQTDALMEALDEGWISGAALDVTDPEPLPDGHALWSKKNVIITPHVSGASESYVERALAILEVNLGRMFEGDDGAEVKLLNRVNRARGY